MAETPTRAVRAAAARFYSDIHAEDASRSDAESILPVAEDQVEKHREIVVELRGLLERAEADLARWATAAANLRATIDPGLDPGGAVLRGRHVGTVAVRLLEESGKPTPIHYRDWQQLIHLAGYTIGGANPQASFLTALHREPRAVKVGNRTGLWELAK